MPKCGNCGARIEDEIPDLYDDVIKPTRVSVSSKRRTDPTAMERSLWVLPLFSLVCYVIDISTSYLASLKYGLEIWAQCEQNKPFVAFITQGSLFPWLWSNIVFFLFPAIFFVSIFLAHPCFSIPTVGDHVKPACPLG